MNAYNADSNKEFSIFTILYLILLKPKQTYFLQITSSGLALFSFSFLKIVGYFIYSFDLI